MPPDPYRKPFSYFDLIETFPKGGCAVCKLLRRDTERAVDGLLYGFTGGEELIAAFNESRGVCAVHGAALKTNKMGNVLGIARLYTHALDALLDQLADLPPGDPPPAALDRLLRREPPTDPAAPLERTGQCPVCERLAEYEAEYLRMFDVYLHDERFAAALHDSAGLCLPHLRGALRAIRTPGDRVTLATIHRDIWRALRDQVAGFADKQKFEHAHRITAEEADSWSRVIDALAGDAGLFGPQRE